MNFIGFRIWMFTVLLNALFLGLGAALIYGKAMGSFPFLVIGVIGGIVITAPLLFIIVPLVRLSRRLPYGTKARIIWLLSMLIVMNLAFLQALEAIVTRAGLDYNDEGVYELKVSTLLSVTLAVFFERNALNRSYELLAASGGQ